MGSDPEDRDDDAASSARAARPAVGRTEKPGRAAPAPGPKPAPKRTTPGSAMSLGLRAGSEFVSAVIVGSGIGWALDRALHTNPAFLIVFFLLGVAAGIWNVIRLTSPKGRRLAAAIRPCLARTRRIKTGRARLQEPEGTPRWGGAKPLGGADDDED